MKKIIYALLLLSSNLIFSQTILSEDAIEKLDALIESIYDIDKPGGIVTILSNSQTLYTNYQGLSNVEYNISISDSTVFNIGSLTKQFTAFTALLLEAEGKLSLEDEITKYLPELSNLPHRITLKQLLNHTHGLPNSEELSQLCGKERMSNKEMVSMLLKINSMNFLPGNKFEYNNSGYTLMAEIISRVEEKPFEDVVRDEVFIPLTMENSTIIDNPHQVVNNKAGSYRVYNNHFSYLNNDKTSMGPTGICTDIRDLSLWANNFLDPKVGSVDMIMNMKKYTKLDSGEIVKYGLGIQSKKYKGINVTFHGGADAAYRSYLMHLPEHDMTIISLSNDGSFAALETAYSITDLLLGLDPVDVSAVESKMLYSENIDISYQGTYEMFPGKYFNIVSRNDSLFFQQYGFKYEIPLKHDSGKAYTIPMLPHYKIEFGENKFDFHIVDSKFECSKVQFEPPSFSESELQKFEGIYQNEDYGVMYKIVINDGKLLAVSGYGLEIQLFSFDKLSFYSSYQFFGKIDFVENIKGECDSFNLSGSFLKDITFVKI